MLPDTVSCVLVPSEDCRSTVTDRPCIAQTPMAAATTSTLETLTHLLPRLELVETRAYFERLALLAHTALAKIASLNSRDDG